MTPYFYDCETTIRNRGENSIGKHQASPWDAKNIMVMFGERTAKGSHSTAVDVWVPPGCHPRWLWNAEKGEKVLLVGHNITFDLHYARKTWPALYRGALKNLYIWDTQQVAYLLSGQTTKYPSLDSLALELGLPLKDDKIKQYWADGVDTDKIPVELLTEYQKHDVDVTESVFRYQYHMIKDNAKLFNLVRVKMDDILCTAQMEQNGMYFDIVTAMDEIKQGEAMLATLDGMLDMHTRASRLGDFKFNPLSPEHVSMVLYGGSYEVTEDVEQLNEDGTPSVYKTGIKKGEVRTKKQKVEVKVKGLGYLPDVVTQKTKKSNVWATGDEVLSKLVGAFPSSILEYRRLSKDVNTYYRGYSALVWPDGFIHPSINHVSTSTGRQSCTSPNLQNVTRDDAS